MARPRSYDRDEVVRAAESQFRTTGYNGTTVDDCRGGQRRVFQAVLTHQPHSPLLDHGIDLLRHDAILLDSKGGGGKAVPVQCA
jgi:hypothetical protein